MRKPSLFVYLSIGLVLTHASCSKHATPSPAQTRSPGPVERDPALTTACDELRRLESITEAGLSYFQYSDRLLTIKGTIDVAMQHTRDDTARIRIEQALFYYVEARDTWNREIRDRSDSQPHLFRESWIQGRRAALAAIIYAEASPEKRQELLVREREEERRLAEEERLAEEAATERKRIATAKHLQAFKQSGTVLLKYIAGDGDRGAAQPLILTTSDLQVPTSGGPRLVWFGDIVEVQTEVGNYYKVGLANHRPVTLRFEGREELGVFDRKISAALKSWRIEFIDLLPEGSDLILHQEGTEDRQAQAREERQARAEIAQQEISDAHAKVDNEKRERQARVREAQWSAAFRQSPRDAPITMRRSW